MQVVETAIDLSRSEKNIRLSVLRRWLGREWRRELHEPSTQWLRISTRPSMQPDTTVLEYEMTAAVVFNHTHADALRRWVGLALAVSSSLAIGERYHRGKTASGRTRLIDIP